MKKKFINEDNDDLDIIGLLYVLYINKLKIITVTFVFLLFSIGAYVTINPSFTSRTEILPISIFENSLYSSFNSLIEPQAENDDKKILAQNRINQINRNYLLSLFLEEVKTKEIIMEAIKKYQIIDKKKFDNVNEYLESVQRKALSLKLLQPTNVDDNKKSDLRLNWTIEFKIHDKKK